MGTRGELFDLWPEWQLGKDRRAAAALRLELYRGGYAKHVEHRVRKRLRDEVAIADTVRAIHVASGLVATVTDAIAVVYQQGAWRDLRGVDPETAKAFSDVVVESDWPKNATSVNRLSWISGPVILVPYTTEARGKVRVQIAQMTADQTEVRRSFDTPDILDAVLWERPDGVFVEVNAEGWHFYDADGHRMPEYERPHGLGYCPAIPFRSRPPGLGGLDWWGACEHHSLLDAAIEVSFRQALAAVVRQNTLAPLVVIEGEIEGIPKLQVMGHYSKPLYTNKPVGEAAIQVHDRSVNVQDYLTEIGAIAAEAIDRYGIALNDTRAFTVNNGPGALAASIRAQALSNQRDDQALWVKGSEQALWSTTCDVVRVSAHQHAESMLPPEELEPVLRVNLPDLADAETQIKRVQALKEHLPLGLDTPRAFLMRRRPELTPTEAEEELQSNIENYISTIKPVVERNVSTDPDKAVGALVGVDAERGVQSASQMQGREGGQASGEARQVDDSDHE